MTTAIKSRVSVIIPVFNGASFLEEALACLDQQEYPVSEIVLIDDGSTDDTAAIANRYQGQIQYHYQAHAGVAAARNQGLVLASGSWIGFLDVDDLWSPEKLKTQLAHASRHPELSAIMGHTRFVQLTERSSQTIVDSCPQMLLGAGLFKRSLFDQIGVFDHKLRHGEDWDWFMRCREQQVPMRVFPDTLLTYRRHNNNLSLKQSDSRQDLMKLLKWSLDRRRALQSSENSPAKDSEHAGHLPEWNKLVPASGILPPSD